MTITTVRYTTNRTKVNPIRERVTDSHFILEEMVSKKRYALSPSGYTRHHVNDVIELRDRPGGRFRGVFTIIGFIDYESNAIIGIVPDKRLTEWVEII